MPRPPKKRLVKEPPIYTEFKPVGVGRRFIDSITLTIDEYEALRLADYEGLSHEQAAEKMQISRPTFTRLIDSAHKKVAQMIVQGKGLSIEGGSIYYRYAIIRCGECGKTFRVEPQNTFNKCPDCGSSNLIYFGHPGFRRGHGRGRHGKHWR